MSVSPAFFKTLISPSLMSFTVLFVLLIFIWILSGVTGNKQSFMYTSYPPFAIYSCTPSVMLSIASFTESSSFSINPSMSSPLLMVFCIPDWSMWISATV